LVRTLRLHTTDNIAAEHASVSSHALKLDKLQRNELFRAVEAAGIGPAAFELLEEGSGITLKHRESDAVLRASRRPPLVRAISGIGGSGPGPQFAVVGGLPSATQTRSLHETWGEVVERVTSWVGELREDLSSPDFWTSLEGVPPLGDDATHDNSPFTPEERQGIAERAAAIKTEAQSRYQLTDQQIQILEAKLDYVVEASKRMGRLDWRNLVAGVVLDMVREAVLPTQTTTKVFNHLLTAVSHMLGHPLQLGQ
jgi:hypothetical protein